MKSSGNGAVIDPLLTLEREDLTGTLEFRARGVLTSIHTRAGEVVFAEGGTLGETLGRMLVRYDRITEDHFGAIIRRLTDAVVDSATAQFGDIAVQYGFLTRDELDVALAQQVKEKIMGCIHRGSGDWRFIPDNPRVAEVGSHVVRTRPTLVEAAMYLSERQIEDVLRLDEHRFPELVAPPSVVADEFELTRDETEILGDLNGTSSLHFLLPMAASPKVASVIAALVMGGGVVLRNAPAESKAPADARPLPPDFLTRRRAGARKDYESMPLPRIPRNGLPVLGSTSDATSWPTVAVARPVRDRRSSRESLEPLQPDAESRASTAYTRLVEDLEARKPVSERRRWPDPVSDEERRLMAEAAFHRGHVLLRNDAPERALPGLHRALELCADEAEYELFVKWAQMLVNDAFVDEDRRAEIEGLAAFVGRRDHYCALAFAVLGHCALKHGKEEASLRFFQRAAMLDPKLVDPARLEELIVATSASKGPALSRPDVRSKVRGELETPLDELVPAAIPRARPSAPRTDSTDLATDPDSAPPDSAPFDPLDRKTPYGGLQIAPFERSVAPEVPAPPTPRSQPSLFPASRLSSLPPAAPQPSPGPPAAVGPASVAPSPPPPSDPGTAPMRAALSPWRIVAAPPSEGTPVYAPPEPSVAPPSSHRRALLPNTDAPAPAPPPRSRRRALWIGVWLGSLSATGAAFYLVGSRSEPTASMDAAPFVETTRSSAVLAPTVTSSSPPSVEPVAVPEPPVSVSESPPVSDARAATTAILKTPKGWGRRIFFDGRSLGDGGRDLTVACGVHRVKVGSSGAERTVTLPCGGTLIVE